MMIWISTSAPVVQAYRSDSPPWPWRVADRRLFASTFESASSQASSQVARATTCIQTENVPITWLYL